MIAYETWKAKYRCVFALAYMEDDRPKAVIFKLEHIDEESTIDCDPVRQSSFNSCYKK